jgi:hypothetical protein
MATETNTTTTPAAAKTPAAKTTAAKTTAAKAPVAKKAPAKKAAAKKPAAKKTTPLRERHLKVLTSEAGYAAAALADEAISFARELPTKADKLRATMTETVKPETVKSTVSELRTTVKTQVKHAPAKLKDVKANELLADAKTTVTTYRSKLTKDLDARMSAFEKHFDTRVAAGRKVVAEVKSNEQLTSVLGQASTTSSKIKGAVTSIRKTADVAVDAGKDQAANAKSQVKGAATSAKKTVETVFEAGKDIAS